MFKKSSSNYGRNWHPAMILIQLWEIWVKLCKINFKPVARITSSYFQVFIGWLKYWYSMVFYAFLINFWRPFWWLYTICIEYDHKHDQWCVSRTYGYDGRLSQWKCQFWQGVSLENLTSNVTLECPGPKQHKSNWSLRKEGI